MRVRNNQIIQTPFLYSTVGPTVDDLEVNSGLIIVEPTTDLDAITGIVGSNLEGAMIVIINNSPTNSLVLSNNTGSAAGNRFRTFTNADLTLLPNGGARAEYHNGFYIIRTLDTDFSLGYALYDSQYLKLDASNSPLTGSLILNANPTLPLGAATKSYVDNLTFGLSWKDPVDAATTTNITLSGEQVIDGVLTNLSRVLVKDQTLQTENGVYDSSPGLWTRSPDEATGADILHSAMLVRAGGTQNGSTQWANSNTSPITIGVTNILFSQIAGGNVYVNGTGLLLTGNVFSIDPSYVADSSTTGYLSFTDWQTFDGKEEVLSFTAPLARTLNTISIANALADGVTKGAAAFTANDFNSALGVISIDYTNGQSASSVNKGFLTSTDWNTFNAKQSALTFGDLTENISNVLTILNGVGAVIGAGTSIEIQQSTSIQDGYLSSTDWNTFNNKQSALTFGNLTEAVSSVLSISNGTGAVIGAGTTIQILQSTTSQSGYLSSTDWNTFNNKVSSITLNTAGVLFNTPVNFTVLSGAATGSLTLANQTANTIFAGPSAGGATTPTFRTLVNADLPNSGVAAGTYQSVTVNTKGVVTTGTNAGVVIGVATIYNTTNLTAGVVNTATPVTFDTNDTISGALAHSTIVNPSRVTASANGRLQVMASVNPERGGGGGANQALSVWWRKNGTDLAFTRRILQLNTATRSTMVSLADIPMVNGDYIEFYFAVEHLSISITSVAAGGGGPAVPAVKLYAYLYSQ